MWGVGFFFCFVGLGFFPLHSCLLPFRDFFGMIALEWGFGRRSSCSRPIGPSAARSLGKDKPHGTGKVPTPPCISLGPTSQRMCSRPGLEAQQVLKDGGTELYSSPDKCPMASSETGVAPPLILFFFTEKNKEKHVSQFPNQISSRRVVCRS